MHWNRCMLTGMLVALVVLVLKDIIRLYDFASTTPGRAGIDLYAYEGAVSARPPGSSTVPSTAISTSSALLADDGAYENFTTDTTMPRSVSSSGSTRAQAPLTA